MDLLTHPLSFSFPRNVTRFILMTWHQMTTARTWGEASTVLPYSLTEALENPTALPRLMNQTCPLGFFFSARKGEKKSGRWDDECVSVCVHACKHVHVFYFPDFHRHIICHRIIQRFHSPSKSLFIIPSVSLGPDVLLDKLVEALEDTFRSDLRKSQTVPNYFFFKYLFYWTWPFSFSKMFLYSSRSCWMYTLHDFFLTKRHS